MRAVESSVRGNLIEELKRMDVPAEAGAALGPRTWYGIGGAAEFLASPRDVSTLSDLLRFCSARSLPWRVLGCGANLLVMEGTVPGVTITLDAPALTGSQIDTAAATAQAGGGARLQSLIIETVRKGLAGLESLAGIPATVGGALRMNAGGAFGEIGPLVQSVTVAEADGAIRSLGPADLGFAYRRSLLGERVVTEATFTLERAADPVALRARLKEVMAYKKDSQPMAADSAGCAFKNPPKSVSEKSAGQLIDEAGCKGLRVGTAEVSSVHANFIVADEHGRAADVLAVMDAVHQRVREQFDVDLEREVVVWGG